MLDGPIPTISGTYAGERKRLLTRSSHLRRRLGFFLLCSVCCPGVRRLAMADRVHADAELLAEIELMLADLGDAL